MRTLKLRDALRLVDAVKLVWRAAPGWTVVSAILAVVQGILPLVAIYLMKLIVDAVTAGITAADHAAAFRQAAFYIVLAGAVGLAMALMRSLGTLVHEAMGQVVTDHVSDLIHSKSMAVDLEYYESSRYYDSLHRAQQEAPSRPVRIVTDLFAAGQSFISMLAMTGLLFTLHWGIAAVVVLVAIPGALVRVHFSREMNRWQRASTAADRRSWYFHWLLTDGSRAKEVRLFGLGELFRRMYCDVRDVLRAERLGIAKRRALADFGSAAAAVLAIFGTFAHIVWQTISGAIGLGSMVMYYQALQTGLSSLQAVLGGMASLYDDSLFIAYYHEFMDIEPQVLSPAKPVPVPRPMTQGVRFEAVDFAYPDTKRTALRGVSLTVRPGEVTALVGPNGSGKTTLVKLLCRLYDPSAGAITLDGADLRGFDVDELRRHMSVIFQDFAQYHMTARENIRMGNVALADDDPAIEAAAREAGADAAIRGLRNGYETVLGKWFAEGEELSVGEWQKVALARAFVRDAQILVFDEPTSALDPEAEWRAFEHIRELAGGRAVILISHRFSTVRTADRIHILDDGCIVESGSHQELIALDGRYRRMYEVQARAYQELDA